MKAQTLRVIYLAFGWLCTALGMLGAFLPVLPTIPFLLLAVWAFSKSSTRLRNWLYHHPRYGEAIQDWFEYGAISTRVKRIAVAAIMASVIVVYLVTEHPAVIFVHLVIMVLVILFILTRPSAKPGVADST